MPCPQTPACSMSTGTGWTSAPRRTQKPAKEKRKKIISETEFDTTVSPVIKTARQGVPLQTESLKRSDEDEYGLCSHLYEVKF